MGKTHEALKRAEKEFKQKKHPQSFYQPPSPILTGSTKTKGSWFMPLEAYEDLKTNFLSRHPGGAVKSILFNGTRHGGGCTTTSVNFAQALAEDSQNKVLLVDVNLRTPGLHEVYQTDQSPDLSELVAAGGQLVHRIKQVGPANLYVISCGGGSLLGPFGFFESSDFEQFLMTMYAHFDYLVLDAPPVLVYAEFRILCSKVDGVVLVLECGKVRKQVAIRAKQELEEAGARILGVVLNKRKHYIPEWIYKRL